MGFIKWKYDKFEGDVIELYELVIPEEDRFNESNLLESDYYKLLTVRDEDGKLEALAIVCLIIGYINPLTKISILREHTLHIDVFCLNTHKRKQNLSRGYFEALKSFLCDDDNWDIYANVKHYSIEAYPWNVEYFKKMGLIEEYKYEPLCTANKPVFLYTKGCKVEEVVKIWQEWQHSWCENLEMVMGYPLWGKV
jgi:hypothetical protein